jgi:hypothetical protein
MGHFNLERLLWAKAIENSQYYSHVIWVPMILLLQHALIYTKNFLLSNKSIPDEGQGSWFIKLKRAHTTMFLQTYDFNLYKGFLMQKNDPNLSDFERVYFSNFLF